MSRILTRRALGLLVATAMFGFTMAGLSTAASAAAVRSGHDRGALGDGYRGQHPMAKPANDPGLGGLPGQTGRASDYPPILTRTNRAPTGYTVTFRYWDPVATSVQVKGEWYFANPSDLTQPASTLTSTVVTPGLLPSQWQPGDFPIDYPNSPAANWPVTNMTLNPLTGVWSYTTPLPSGTFTYGFFVNCFSPSQSGCTEISDPSNPPWNQIGGLTIGSTEPTSQVYVPSDPRFGTVNYWWQAPNREHGTLTDVTYPSPGHVNPPGVNYLAIYTPPGYNSARPTPYPTLYLLHGAGGNEVDWSTQGDAKNILDNLIDTGQIQPMVVVMPTFNGYPASTVASNQFAPFDQDIIDNVIPYVQSHYDVSTSASERAFAGLSEGGYITNSLLFNYTSEFGYYGVMSPVFTAPTFTPQLVSALQQVGIFVGGGWQDPIHYFATEEISALTSAGVPVMPDFMNAGHEWYVWRILLKDFLTRIAFWPSVTGGA